MDQILSLIDVQKLITTVVEFLPRVVAAVLILLAFRVAYRLIRPALERIFHRAGLHEALISLIVESIVRYTLIIVGLVMAVAQLGVNVGAALAGLGIAGVALGFAAQDTVANMISGIIIFWDKPFVVGDWIETSGKYGQVSDITLRSTRVRTPRNTYVVLPNKAIIDVLLENYTKRGAIRVDVPVGIAYKEDIRETRRVLLNAIGELEGIKEDPAPDVVVQALGGSSVDLLVRVWIDDGRMKQPVTSRVVEAAKLALDAAGIQIPFPHLQLFVDAVEEPVWKALGRTMREAS